MKVEKMPERPKTHTFPCVLENVEKGLAGVPGLILFCYENESDEIIGVILEPGTSRYVVGASANNWSIKTAPDHWKPVTVSLIME